MIHQGRKVKITLVKLSSIGDVIHALPLAISLKERYPEAHLEWIVQKEPLPLLRGHPAVDSIRIFPRREGIRSVLSFLRTLWSGGKSDLAIDAQGNMKSALILFASRAKERIGFHRKNCRDFGERDTTATCIPAPRCPHRRTG